MNKFINEILSRYPLTFLAVGCVFVLVGVTGAVSFLNLNVQNEIHQLVLLVFGLLLVAGAFGFAAKDWFWPHPPLDPRTHQSKINPQAYGVKVDPPPKKKGAPEGKYIFERGEGILTGSITKPLPSDLRLWLFNIGGREGLTEYWPVKSITPKGKKWDVEYRASNFEHLHKRNLQVYMVGEDGQRLIRCFRRINERHAKKTAQVKPGHEPGYEAIAELTSDFVEACPVVDVTLTKPAP